MEPVFSLGTFADSEKGSRVAKSLSDFFDSLAEALVSSLGQESATPQQTNLSRENSLAPGFKSPNT